MHVLRIVPDVPGPGGEPGALLEAPRDEALDWDVRSEIASTGRHWVDDRQAWWVAASYLPTLQDIVARHSPRAAPTVPPAPAARAAARRGWLDALVRLVPALRVRLGRRLRKA